MARSRESSKRDCASSLRNHRVIPNWKSEEWMKTSPSLMLSTSIKGVLHATAKFEHACANSALARHTDPPDLTPLAIDQYW